MPPRELSDDEVFGAAKPSHVMSDADVWSDYDMTGPSDQVPQLKKKSLALGFYQGIMKPLDNLGVAAEAGAQAAGIDTNRVNHFLGMPSAAEAEAQHKAAIARSSGRPAVSGEIAGNIVGTVPAMVATKNPFVAGALQGAALTDARDPMGVGIDAAKGAALNWFGGKAVDAAADLVSPVIDPAVQRMASRGVKLTPGMVKGEKAMVREDKAMSKPGVGEAIYAGRTATQDTFNTAAVNEALAPLGVKVPSPVKPGNDSIAYAKKQITDAYDVLVPKLSVNINGQQFAQNLGPQFQALPAAQQKEFMRLITLHMKNGQLSGQAVKDAQEALRQEADDYAAGGPIDRKMSRAFRAADDELTQALIAQNPQYASDLTKVNTAYKGYRIVADAASRADGGVINTGQLKQAVRRGDRSKSKDAMARGEAFMQDFSNDARDVIPARYPDSGTAGRQPKNLFARLGGVGDTGLYTADDWLQSFRLAPRPRGAATVAKGVKRLARPVGGTAVAASQQAGN
jgi:hypothetical protein